ncbi:MAG: ABC transporter permease [Alphaproteobacteria bacterium]|nr:ABC transporter permease [Alphaproteobacteria bacterium]
MENLTYKISNGVLRLDISGDYKNKNLPEVFLAQIKSPEIKRIEIDAKDLNSWDSSLLVMLLDIYHKATALNIKFDGKNFPNGVQKLIELSLAVKPQQEPPLPAKQSFLDCFGDFGLHIFHTFMKGAKFALSNLRTFFWAPVFKPVSRTVDFWFAFQECGPKALPIVLLISFMVGLILAFVGAIQLQIFGAQVYVASLVTIGMTRIIGAIMVGIIMAGRTGASFAATIGTMQVNEEIDALKTMGVKTEEFLIFPRLKALVISMPILTMFADFAGILGGAAVGILALDIPSSEYFRYAYKAWHLRHFLVGIFHALVFGFIIALSGCYFGVNCGRDADSVGTSTTKSVVYGIVWMIIATGLITFCLQRMHI